MRVFISSLISGMGPIRSAAREVVTTLRGEPVMAEDFGAQPHSPQIACLTGLRRSDLVVLILGEQYGALQPSALSATHEEYREAKGRKPVIAFVQEGVSRDPQQIEFVAEVQAWEGGLFRGSFSTPADLRILLTRALHDYELANAVGPVDHKDLVARAVAALPAERRGYSSSGATVALSVSGGPTQSIIRPIELEKPALADALHQKALFGERRLFDLSKGVDRRINRNTLVISQAENTQVSLNEQGTVFVTIPIRQTGRMNMELIYESVQEQIADALEYCCWLFDHVDPTQRLTHIAVAVTLVGADHMAWRTLRESEANPNSMSLGSGGQYSPVSVHRPRAALRLDATHVVEDLVVPLRRQWH
ncbi:MAG: DUF4062 domain-containing protein [Acidobacteriaceae bacterium]